MTASRTPPDDGGTTRSSPLVGQELPSGVSSTRSPAGSRTRVSPATLGPPQNPFNMLVPRPRSLIRNPWRKCHHGDGNAMDFFDPLARAHARPGAGWGAGSTVLQKVRENLLSIGRLPAHTNVGRGGEPPDCREEVGGSPAAPPAPTGQQDPGLGWRGLQPGPADPARKPAGAGRGPGVLQGAPGGTGRVP
jgi:hypothetical protein